MIGPAGKRRHLLTIYYPDTTTVAEDGSVAETPRVFAKVFGQIQPKGGQEKYVALGQQDTHTHVIKMPYLTGMTPKMHGVYNGRRFNFENINNVDEMNRELIIQATELQ